MKTFEQNYNKLMNIYAIPKSLKVTKENIIEIRIKYLRWMPELDKNYRRITFQEFQDIFN